MSILLFQSILKFIAIFMKDVPATVCIELVEILILLSFFASFKRTE